MNKTVFLSLVVRVSDLFSQKKIVCIIVDDYSKLMTLSANFHALGYSLTTYSKKLAQSGLTHYVVELFPFPDYFYHRESAKTKYFFTCPDLFEEAVDCNESSSVYSIPQPYFVSYN